MRPPRFRGAAHGPASVLSGGQPSGQPLGRQGQKPEAAENGRRRSRGERQGRQCGRKEQ